MDGRTRTSGAVLHLRLVCFGIRDEFRQSIRRQFVVRNQHHRACPDQYHRRKVGQRIVRRMLVKPLVLRVCTRIADYDLVKVRCSLRDAKDGCRRRRIFSMTTSWASSERRGAIARATISLAAPAAQGTARFTRCVSQLCRRWRCLQSPPLTRPQHVSMFAWLSSTADCFRSLRRRSRFLAAFRVSAPGRRTVKHPPSRREA